MNNIFIYTTQLEPDTGAVRNFLYNNINNNDTIWMIGSNRQKLLYEFIKNNGYNVHLIPSLYERLGPKGEEAIYHFCCKKTQKSIFFIGPADTIPRALMIAATYHKGNSLMFKII